MRNACMTKRQLDLKLGPILGQITELLDSWPWKRKWANTHTAPGVMCHAQVLAGQWSIKIKAVAFCSFRMSEPQITRLTFDKIFKRAAQNWRKEVPSMIGTPMASKDIIYHFASVHTNCSQGALLCSYSGVQQHWSKLGSIQVEQEYVTNISAMPNKA